MLFFWGIINISIIICFIFDFFNTERYLMAEMYLKYFLLPYVFKFPIGHSSNFYHHTNAQFSLSEFEQFHRH